MNLQKTIAQTVREDYRTAPVFKAFGLDFCCGGKVPISEAIERKGISKEELTRELKKAIAAKNTTHDYDSWDAQFLSEYIQNTHHSYTRKAIQAIQPFLEKVVRVHADAHPELTEIKNIFSELSEELLHHMQTEEELFADMQNTNEELLAHLRDEHEHAGASMKRIRELTDEYTPPEHACNTYRVTFKLLEELEEDLHLHIHLENNILFEKLQA